jgi:hypothetical protein
MECLDSFERFLHDEKHKLPALVEAGPLCWPLSALLFLPFNYASTRHLFRQDENLGFGTTFAQLRCSCLSGALTPCR